MKIIQFFIMICLLVSCKKDTIYYYADHTEIKDSTVIRFVDTELKKLNINLKEDLKIYTTLDSVSYKTNLDSVRTKVFENASHYYIPKNRPLFDHWFREKIIMVNNETGRVVSIYNTFKNIKYDRNGIDVVGMRTLINLGSLLNEDAQQQIPEDYFMYSPSAIIPIDSFIVKKRVTEFLSKFNIDYLKKDDFFSNQLSFLDAVKIFQTINRNGICKDPFVIQQILENGHIIYRHKENSFPVLSQAATEKIQQCLSVYKTNKLKDILGQLKDVQNLLYFGITPFYSYLINDGKYTYFIYISGAVVTDPDKKTSRTVPPEWMKKIGIEYYNAIRK